MAKPLLLMLHGVGSHSSNWADALVAQLGEIASTFPLISARGPLADQVEVRPLHYDTLFDEQLDRWEALGDRVKGFADDSAIKLPRLVSFLNDNLIPNDERGFVWNGVMDAVSYRGVTVTRDQIRTHVMKEVVSAINRHLAQHPGAEVSMLGHSLGTIVTHDVLHLLGTGAGGAAFSAKFTRLANVFMLANATRLGPGKFIDFKPDASLTRPVSAGPVAGSGNPYCGAFYNINNRWDPVGSWARFAPKQWGDGLHDIEIRHIHQVNVHGFSHYLAHPRVHIPLLRALLGSFTIPERVAEQRTSDFTDLKPSSCVDAIATLMNDLDRIRNAVNGGNLDEVAMGMVSMYRAVRSARERCPQMFNESDGVL